MDTFHSIPFNFSEVEQLAWEGLEKVPSNCWVKVIMYVREKVEGHYWSCDGLHEDCVKRFVIKPDGDTDSGSDNTQCSCSDDGSGAEDDGEGPVWMMDLHTVRAFPLLR